MFDWFKKKKEKEGGFSYGYKINLEQAGFYNIKIGDSFEGCACGNFFRNQVCNDIKDEMVYGTTTLVVFRKENIRPIKEDSVPPSLETYGEGPSSREMSKFLNIN